MVNLSRPSVDVGERPGGPRDPAFDKAVEALIRKGGRADAEARAIDWSLSPVRPRWATQRAYVEAVSQLLHAERLTRRACSRLAQALTEPAAARFIESQARDEARHAAMYARYLARIGDVAPMDEALAASLDSALEWHESVPAMMVAFNVVLEGEAVHLHGAAARAFPCPLLHRIATTVGRDEARHTAFGRLYLRRMLADASIVSSSVHPSTWRVRKNAVPSAVPTSSTRRMHGWSSVAALRADCSTARRAARFL